MTDQSTTAEPPGPAGAPPGRTGSVREEAADQPGRPVRRAGGRRSSSSSPASTGASSARTSPSATSRQQMFPDVFTVALRNTIIYTVGGFVFAFLLGLLIALMRLSSVRPYRWIALVYIEIFRGLPAAADLPVHPVPAARAARLRGARRHLRPGHPGPGHRRRGLHGRDAPGGHPGGAQGADGGGPLAGHVARAGR